MKQRERARLAEEIIRECKDEEFQYIDAGWLAAELDVTIANLSTSFKRYNTITLQQFLIEEKIRRADMLFLRGKHNVTEAAALLGYNSVSHFIKAYKKIKGKTPGQFIQRVIEIWG